jgi:hypothetical protein
MNNPDRTLLDQINDAWDDHNQGKHARPDHEAAEFFDVIDSLHRADTARQPSHAFRSRLREQLLSESSSSATSEGEFSFTVGESQAPVGPQAGRNNGEAEVNRRGWWISHIGELAAIIVVLVVASAGAIWWQAEDGDGSPQPGATGGEADEQIAIPDPDEPGFWSELTLEEAQALTPFTLVIPESLPDGYELDHVAVHNSASAFSNDGGRLYPLDDGDEWMTAILGFRSEESEDTWFKLAQYNYVPSSLKEDVEKIPAIGPDIESRDEIRLFRGDLEIDGVEILYVFVHTLREVPQYPVGHFVWYQDGLTMHLAVDGRLLSPDGDISEEALRRVNASNMNEEYIALIESIVTERESDETGPGFGAGVNTRREASPEPEGIQEPDSVEDPASDNGQTTIPDGNATTMSVREAVAQAPFALVDTGRLPVDAEDGVAEFARHEQGSPVASDHPDANEPNRVTLFFVSPLDQEPDYTLEVIQTTDVIPHPEGETLEIAGHPAEFVVLGQTDTMLEAGWFWTVNEVEYGVLITVTDPDSLESTDELEETLPLSEDDIAPIVESTLR